MMDELTINRGCFNCEKLKDCKWCKLPKTKEQLELINTEDGKPYRYGCCCGQWESIKEVVQFT